MTIQEALDIVDELKPNMMTRKTKVKFLQELEQKIHAEILMKHAHEEEQETKPEFTDDSDPGTVLIVPEPYSMVYVYWLMYKIDILNQEDARMNADYAHFSAEYLTMIDWWNRTYMPLTRVRELMK